MKVDLKLIPSEVLDYDVRDRMVVVVDVFRATSTMITALSNGVDYVLPVERVEEAFQLRKILKGDVILAGERKSLKIEGFDLCNSPTEILRRKDDLPGKGMILTTTNGTKAITSHSEVDDMIIGSFLNIGSSVDFVTMKGKDVLLVCSGANGRFSIEDFIFCGEFIDRMISKNKEVELSSSAYVARKFCADNIENLNEIIMVGEHTKNLIKLGFEDDVKYCLRRDVYHIIAKADRIIVSGKEYVVFRSIPSISHNPVS